MQSNSQTPQLVNNTKAHHFEMQQDGKTAFIDYTQNSDVLTLNHTEVPEEFEGKGLGSKLVEKTLNYIEEHNQKIIPLCSFVVAYLRRHPEWQRVVLGRG